MFDRLESFQMWALAQIVASLSWPVSFMAVSSLGMFTDLSEPSLPIIWLLGSVMGIITTLFSGLFVKHQISHTWKWIIANIVGIPLSLTAAYLIFPFTNSLSEFAAVGLFSGLIAGAAQSLSIERQYSKAVPMISGSVGWALAFIFGYLLVVKETTSIFTLMPNGAASKANCLEKPIIAAFEAT